MPILFNDYSISYRTKPREASPWAFITLLATLGKQGRPSVAKKNGLPTRKILCLEILHYYWPFLKSSDHCGPCGLLVSYDKYNTSVQRLEQEANFGPVRVVTMKSWKKVSKKKKKKRKVMREKNGVHCEPTPYSPNERKKCIAKSQNWQKNLLTTIK